MRAAQQEGVVGYIDTPAQGNVRPPGVVWCADNGAFSDNFNEDKWWKFLLDNAHDADTCLFAVAPDVVGDAWRTMVRSRPWMQKIRALGYPVAYVAQDGFDVHPPWSWDEFDVLFIGGTDDFKLGAGGTDAVRQAKEHGKWVHMGRVNSERRYKFARAIGCDSVDGTHVTYGPDKNIHDVLAWTRLTNHPELNFGDIP